MINKLIWFYNEKEFLLYPLAVVVAEVRGLTGGMSKNCGSPPNVTAVSVIQSESILSSSLPGFKMPVVDLLYCKIHSSETSNYILVD